MSSAPDDQQRNEPTTDVEAIVDGLIKNHNLTSLMDKELRLFREIRMLNSEFHTLLYENYNKLISAAQIIGRMSNNFDNMEQEINSLSSNMEQIIGQSDLLSSNLSDKLKNLSQLSSTYSTLKGMLFACDLNDLVVSNGQSLSRTVMEDIEEEDWLSDQKPRHVRPGIIKLVEDLDKIAENLSGYCEEGPHIELSGQPSLYHSHHSRVNNPLMNNNIKKLFAERIEIFSPVTFNRRTILFGICKIILKAMVETIRTQVFNKNGVQQIQIDTKYLQHELSRLVSDENVIFALLDEAITSADIRCLVDR